MKPANPIFSIPVALLALGLPLSAHGQSGNRSHIAEIVQRGPDGRATAVRIDGQNYHVCTSNQQDDCIEPYAAGLRWGDRPLPYWPGRPASEIDGDHGHIRG